MPNTRSAAKALRQNERRYIRNKALKERIKRWIKKFYKAIDDKNKEEGVKIFKMITKLYDKAAKRNVVHRNKANRKKSDLQKKLNAL